MSSRIIETATRLIAATTTIFIINASVAFANESLDCECAPRKPRPVVRIVRPYPICFFNERPTEQEMSDIRKGIVRVMHAYLGRSSSVSFSSDSRWVVARGSNYGHSSLEKLWPRLGCIGAYRSGITYPYYSHCLNLLRETLRSHDYLKRGENSDFLNGFLGYCNGSSATDIKAKLDAVEHKDMDR